MADYCTADEVRAWLNIDDPNLDGIIALAIGAASRWVDGHCHRKFSKDATASAKVFDRSTDGTIFTDDIADAASVIVKTDSTLNGSYATTLTVADYQLLPFNSPPYWQIAPTTAAFPVPYGSRRGLVQVTAKWGWPAVPDEVHQATIMQAARIVKRRTSPEGVAGFNDFGVVRVTATDRDIEALLDNYRLATVA